MTSRVRWVWSCSVGDCGLGCGCGLVSTRDENRDERMYSMMESDLVFCSYPFEREKKRIQDYP